MRLRYCMPRVVGRGAGLGNELVPWARAFIASTVLEAKLLPPAFGLNPRRYGRLFGTPRYDWLSHRLIERALPIIEFDEQAYLSSGGGDVADAIRCHAERHDIFGRKNFLWVTHGMWGGYRHIVEAREFVRSILYLSKSAALNLSKLKSRLRSDVTLVGMHIRMGDFAPPPKDAIWKGRFNVSLPMSWYVNIARSLVERLGQNIQFLVVSDGTPAQLAPILEEFDAVTTGDMADADASDILALAQCDLLVCSVSSFSCWAAFLSHSPYVWFEPHLQTIGNCYSIWGHESAQLAEGGNTRKAIQRMHAGLFTTSCRGVPIGLDGQIPDRLLERILNSETSEDSDSDLLLYGVQPLIKRSCISE